MEMEAEFEILRSQHSLRGRRPGAERLPVDEGCGDPPAARRPLDEAAKMMARDGLAAVRKAAGVGTLAAGKLVARRLGVDRRRPLRWLHSGFSVAMPYAFALTVEHFERERFMRKIQTLTKKPASQGQRQAV